MGIPIGPSFEIGGRCVAGEGPPHNYWPANQTPLYVYLTISGMAKCLGIPGGLPEPPNGQVIRLTNQGACQWTSVSGGWVASWNLGMLNTIQLHYFDGMNNWNVFQGHPPAGKTIASNIYVCGVGITLATGGFAELVWSVAPRKILFDYNLAAVDGTRIAVIPVDADTSQYRLANKDIGMNIWVEYDH